MAILWLFWRLSFLILILLINYSVLLEHYHTILNPAVAPWDRLSPRGQVYSAVQPLLLWTTLSQALHHCYGGHLKYSFSPSRPSFWKEKQLFCPKVCLCRGRRWDLRHICPIQKQKPEVTISPNTSSSLFYAATVVLENRKLFSMIALCTPLTRLLGCNIGHCVNI